MGGLEPLRRLEVVWKLRGFGEQLRSGGEDPPEAIGVVEAVALEALIEDDEALPRQVIEVLLEGGARNAEEVSEVLAGGRPLRQGR